MNLNPAMMVSLDMISGELPARMWDELHKCQCYMALTVVDSHSIISRQRAGHAAHHLSGLGIEAWRAEPAIVTML